MRHTERKKELLQNKCLKVLVGSVEACVDRECENDVRFRVRLDLL